MGLTATQKHLLGMLVEIDELCTKYGLTYFLAGGCLIGALRNRGFLPWDDDADILMPIEDMRRLEGLEAEGKLPPNRALIKLDDYDAGMLCRYVDTSTTTYFRGTYTSNQIPLGQFVDIYVLCHAPDNEKAQRKLLTEFHASRNIRSNWFDTKGMDRRDRVILNRRWNLAARLLGRKVVSGFYEKRLFKPKWEKSNTMFVRSPLGPEFRDRSFYDETVRVPFEDTTLCVFGRARESLSLTFGSNWVEVPKSSAIRKPASHEIWIDLEFPYTRTQREIGTISNLPVARFLNRGIKAATYHDAVVKMDVAVSEAEFETKLRARQIERRWQESGIPIEELEKTHYFASSIPALSSYHSMSGWPRFAGWKIGIPVSDEVLYAAWYPSYLQGNYAGPIKAINRVRPDGEMGAELQAFLNKCLDADTVMDALWSRDDYDTAREVVAKHDADEHPSIVFLRASLAVRYHDAKSADDYRDIIKRADKALDSFPGDGELQFWKAKALIDLGQTDEALPYLRAGADHAINAFVRLMGCDDLEKYSEVSQNERAH